MKFVCISHLANTVTNTQGNPIKKERALLSHDFRGFSPFRAEFIAMGLG